MTWQVDEQLVLFSVAEFSYDYYFGIEPLSSKLSSDGSILEKDCDETTMKYQCYKKCGVHHLCILGQCVCFKVLALPEGKWKDEKTLFYWLCLVFERQVFF